MDTVNYILLALATVVATWCILLLVSRLSFLQKFPLFRGINNKIREQAKCSVMNVTIDWSDNTIECIDWGSQRIPPFCGKFTWELWDEIQPYLRTSETAEGKRETHIYIIKNFTTTTTDRGGVFDKVNWFAYCEPITEYVKNKELLKTGNGYKNYYIDKQKELAFEQEREKKVSLTLPAFDSWKDIHELYRAKLESEFSVITDVAGFVMFMQENYPNGVKVGNIKYQTK